MPPPSSPPTRFLPPTPEVTSLPPTTARRPSPTPTPPDARSTPACPAGTRPSSKYDRFGNTTFELTATNRELALGNADYQINTQSELGILSDSTAERARQLGNVSVYSTDGKRQLEEFGPLHLITLAKALTGDADSPDLPAGVQVAAREHTVNSYDEGRPADGTATVTDQITTTKVGAAIDGYPTDGDTRTTATAYDWVKGLPTSVITDPNGLKLAKTTSYDTQGRVTKTTLPKSTGSDAGATVTQYWSATGCAGRPEWADLECSTGPAGAITGGGSNPSALPVKSTEYDRWGNPAKVTETANGVTRTTTITYDAAGRPKQTQVTGGVGTAVPAQSTTYDPTAATWQLSPTAPPPTPPTCSAGKSSTTTARATSPGASTTTAVARPRSPIRPRRPSLTTTTTRPACPPASTTQSWAPSETSPAPTTPTAAWTKRYCRGT